MKFHNHRKSTRAIISPPFHHQFVPFSQQPNKKKLIRKIRTKYPRKPKRRRLKSTLTPESETTGAAFSASAFSARVSKLSLRLSGLEEGGRGGSGLFIFMAGDGWEFRSGGGAFSLEHFCFLNDLDLGFGEDERGGSRVSLKIVFLGCMKCFIFNGSTESE